MEIAKSDGLFVDHHAITLESNESQVFWNTITPQARYSKIFIYEVYIFLMIE